MRPSTESERQPRNSYASDLKAHLSRYKVDAEWGLGIEADGECLHRAYSHILPANERDLNVLPAIRDDFWRYWKTLTKRPSEDGKPPRLHRCFPHLNSSQALAFNLFYPFVRNDFADDDVLLTALRSGATTSDGGRIERIIFEYEPDKKEGSNFDVAIFCTSRVILIEVKLTETEFGRCAEDEPHKKKRLGTYERLLRDKVSSDCVNGPQFFENYQVLRHFARLDGDKVEVRFLFPKANHSLAEGARFINTALNTPFRQQVGIVYLEAFVESILAASSDRSELHAHYQAVSRKYILEERGVPRR